MSEMAWTADRLAAWAMSLSFADLAADVVARAEDCILDAIGCAAAGLEAPGARRCRDLAAHQYRDGASPVWFRSSSLNAPGAAFANSAAVSALDIDDGHRLAMGHPGAAVIPSALAIAAEGGAGGRDVMAAIVAGYEIAVRLGAAEARKSYHSGNWSGFGAAIAGAKLRGLSPAQAAHALTITAYHGPRLGDLTQSRFMGGNVKESIPWSVITGLSACDLAQRGYTGCRDALDLDGRFDTGLATRELGHDLRISNVYFKRYSICRWSHAAVEALMRITRSHGIDAAQVRRVRVETFREAAALNNCPHPQTLESAQYSLPFAMGIAATLGDAMLSPMPVAVLNHEPAVEFASRVVVSHAPEMDGYLPNRTPARVSVETGSASFRQTVVEAWGDAGGATSRAALRQKFVKLLKDRAPFTRSHRVVAAVEGLKSGDVESLLRAVSPPIDAGGHEAA